MADKIDIPSFQIAASKMRADGNAYFKLFEKHVPRNLDMNSVVLLYKLDNLSCIYNIINMNSKAHYVVVSNTAVNTALQVILDKSIDVEYIKEFDFKETDMKFDCIIMNPPYSRNLHIKILAEAIKHLKDEKSVCVNLSPVRWLQDPLAKYKKNCDLKRFEESVAKHIESLETITSKTGAEVFSNRLNIQCGVYKCTKSGGYNYKSAISNSILDKIIAAMPVSTDNYVKYSKPMKYACVVTLISGGAAGNTEVVSHWMMDKKKAYYDNDKNADGLSYKEYRDKIIWGNLKAKAEVTHIEFDTAEERENFYNFHETLLMRYVFRMQLVDVHVHPEFIPWLGSATNPRTGLVGYKGEWTDADLKAYFQLTDDEWKTVEETMAKYR